MPNDIPITMTQDMINKGGHKTISIRAGKKMARNDINGNYVTPLSGRALRRAKAKRDRGIK